MLQAWRDRGDVVVDVGPGRHARLSIVTGKHGAREIELSVWAITGAGLHRTFAINVRPSVACVLAGALSRGVVALDRGHETIRKPAARRAAEDTENHEATEETP